MKVNTLLLHSNRKPSEPNRDVGKLFIPNMFCVIRSWHGDDNRDLNRARYFRGRVSRVDSGMIVFRVVSWEWKWVGEEASQEGGGPLVSTVLLRLGGR